MLFLSICFCDEHNSVLIRRYFKLTVIIQLLYQSNADSTFFYGNFIQYFAVQIH